MWGESALRRMLLAVLFSTGVIGTVWAGGETIDRVVAIVGREAITASEVDLQLRLQAFVNALPYEPSDRNRAEALERLIQQRLMRREMSGASYPGTAGETPVPLSLYRKQVYPGGISFDEALQEYAITEEQLIDFVRRAQEFIRFVDFRFRTGLNIDASEVEAYYQQTFMPVYEARHGKPPPPLSEIYDQVESSLLDEEVESRLDVWIKDVRSTTRIHSPAPLSESGPASP